MAATYEGKAARAATVVRADLSSRIFQQSLQLDRIVLSKDSSTTMITADVERVQEGVRKMHDFWANLATIAIGLWIITVQLGPSSLFSLVLIFGEDRIRCSAGHQSLNEANELQLRSSSLHGGPRSPVSSRRYGWKQWRSDCIRRSRSSKASRASSRWALLRPFSTYFKLSEARKSGFPKTSVCN